MVTKVCIITAELDEGSHRVLSDLRKAHFPSHINFLDAHLTLFHHLPLELVLHEKLDLPNEPFDVNFSQPFFIGTGTAIEAESEELKILRSRLALTFSSHLTAQDKQLKRFHVTIQNKVRSNVAKQFFEQFKTEWTSMDGKVTGLLIWEYLGGPWKLVETKKFC